MIQEAIGKIQDEMENGLNYIYPRKDERMQGAFFPENASPELDHRTRKVTEKFSENLHIIGNEPSLAFFRIEEHVRKTLPQLVDKKHEVQELQQSIQGSCFDTEYAINATNGMHKSSVHFRNIQDLLKNAMFMKQQLIYEETRREQEKSKPSMYGRSNRGGMLRTQTVDIPVSSHEGAEFSRSSQNLSAGVAEASPRVRSSSLSHQSSPRHEQKK